MSKPIISRLIAASALCLGVGLPVALANPPKGGGAPAPHAAAAPAPHFNAPAAPHFNAPAPHFAPQAGHGPAGGAPHYGAPAGRYAAPAAHAGGYAPGRAGAEHAGAREGHPSTFNRSAPGHAEAGRGEAGRGVPGRAEAGRNEAGRNEAGRGEAGHEASRLVANDPARAHAGFDEHVRNPQREHDIARLHGHDFHVRDVRYFNDREWHDWRGGYWQRDYYDGRFGWWFDVGGIYYPYAAPIFPFPLVVASLIVAEDMPVIPPPPLAGLPVLPALPNAAYHCASPSGFYPTLGDCQTGWMMLAQH